VRRDLIGQIVGDKYRIASVVGEGGMGTVFEAEHLQLGRRVAIKVLNRAHLERRDAVARFYHEARTAGAIGHPNICEVYDVGHLEDGSPYMVMERLHGHTLADRINLEGALPFDDVINTLTQVLSALHAAHEKSIIHRDIKPENVFLAERVGCAPVAKILDFGISKTDTDDPELSLTRTGMVMGTPFYMAPEQVRGEPIDYRIDLYACGVMLYETLTGRRPFVAPNYNALVIQLLSTEPRSPIEIRPAIPVGFVPIINRALAKRRTERYQGAAEFLQDLTTLRDEIARGPSPAEIAKLVEEVRRASAPPPRPSSVPPMSDSVDIPIVFAETGTGARPVPELAPPLTPSDMADYGVARPGDDRCLDEVHDTIVDPTGRVLREMMIGPAAAASEADATVRTAGLDPDQAEALLQRASRTESRPPVMRRSSRPPGGDEAGRYSLVSERDELAATHQDSVAAPARHAAAKPPAIPRAPRPARGLDASGAPRLPPAAGEAPPRAATKAKPPAREPAKAGRQDPATDDDDATTLFVSSSKSGAKVESPQPPLSTDTTERTRGPVIGREPLPTQPDEPAPRSPSRR
jgi:serine/threonine protein kinase